MKNGRDHRSIITKIYAQNNGCENNQNDNIRKEDEDACEIECAFHHLVLGGGGGGGGVVGGVGGVGGVVVVVVGQVSCPSG
jgi:hypothetical protein